MLFVYLVLFCILHAVIGAVLTALLTITYYKTDYVNWYNPDESLFIGLFWPIAIFAVIGAFVYTYTLEKVLHEI